MATFHSDKTAVTPQLSLSTDATFPAEPLSERSEVANKKSKSGLKHDENHTDNGDVVRDIIIGFADGLTVPFALTAGLSSYVPLFFQVSVPY